MWGYLSLGSQVCQCWQAWLSRLESKSSIQRSCNYRLEFLLGGCITNILLSQSRLLFILIRRLYLLRHLPLRYLLLRLLEMFMEQLRTHWQFHWQLRFQLANSLESSFQLISLTNTKQIRILISIPMCLLIPTRSTSNGQPHRHWPLPLSAIQTTKCWI